MKGILFAFQQYSLRKKFGILILFFVLIFAALVVILNITKKPGYTTAKVTRGDIVETVSESGKIATSGTVEVYSPTNGIIKEVFVANGDSVEEGQELVIVKSSATEQEQKAAYANYLTATSTLGTAQATMHSLQSAMFAAWDEFNNLAQGDSYENEDGTPKNDQRTLPQFHIAEKTWLSAEAKYKNQQSVVAQAQAQVASTLLLYQATQDSTIKAPAAGRVYNLSVAPGSSVLINSLLAPVTPVLYIGNFISTEVVISLGENDIAKVKEGQKVHLEFDSIKDESFEGIVKRVDNVGTDDQGVILYKAYIEVLLPDSNLKPGMSADAEVTTEELNNVLLVPNTAVKPYEGGKAVRVPGNSIDDTEFVPVKIGIRDSKNTQIVDGLSEGQIVITSLTAEDTKKTNPLGF